MAKSADLRLKVLSGLSPSVPPTQFGWYRALFDHVSIAWAAELWQGPDQGHRTRGHAWKQQNEVPELTLQNGQRHEPVRKSLGNGTSSGASPRLARRRCASLRATQGLRRCQVAFAMEKGGVLDMPVGMGRITVGLGWDVDDGEVDLDVSAVLPYILVIIIINQQS